MKSFLLILVAFSVGCSHYAQIGQPPLQAGPSNAAEAKINDVVGNYYFGDGLGVNCRLELKEDSTFHFTWRGCLGVYDENEGAYNREGNLVVLIPNRPHRHDVNIGVATRFHPVTWGDRLYLVSGEQMLGFTSRVANGWRGNEYGGRSSDYYLRDGVAANKEGDLPAIKGEPVVPDFFRPYLTNEFSCSVIKQINERRVVIDKGSADGVAVRTMLSTADGDWLRVEFVRSHESEVEVWDGDAKLPAVGASLKAAGI